jgi:LuxR family maltose regulon positive regulatory protein
MLRPLLKTKITIPPVQSQTVFRARLHGFLDAFVENSIPLLLISAKAGAGKSSLVSQWLQRSQRKAAWLSLDSNDNDPGRFMRYLIAALEQADMLGQLDISAVFDGLAAPDPTSLAVLLLEKCSDSETAFLLVLDDYHVIEQEWAHRFIESVNEGLGRSGHLVLITRADPPMPLARWRGRSQLAEIRDAGLRFLPDEIDRYFQHVMKLELSPSQLAVLEHRTEGWIVGLQMAAITMRNREQAGLIDEFIQGFGGANRYILDYLLEEVLGDQPPLIQEFLFETSILDRLSAQVCDAVFSFRKELEVGVDVEHVGNESELPKSSEILRQLEQENLFLVPLDDERHWYRYHHLFADLLRNELKQRRSHDDIRELHERAGRWFRENQWIEEAMTHALAAHDYDGAAAIIEDNIVRMLTQSTMPQLLQWIEMLPANVVRSRPWIAIYWANTLAFAGQVEGVEELLTDVEELSSGAPDARALRGYAAAIRAYLANLQGDSERTFEMAALSRESQSGGYINARAMASYALADAHFALDHMPEAEEALLEMLNLGRDSGQLLLKVTALCELGSVRRVQGQLQAAQEFYSQAWDQLVESNGLGTRLRCHYEFGMADLLYEWDRLEEAHQHAMIGMDIRSRLGGYYVIGDLPLMRILQALGDTKAALKVLHEVEQVVSSAHVQLSGVLALRAASVIECLAVGDIERARFYADQCVGVTDLEVLARASLLLTLERYQDALALVEPQIGRAKSGGRVARTIELLCDLALACKGLGAQDEASSAVMEALSLARPEGFIRAFLDKPPALARLIHESIEPHRPPTPGDSPMDLLTKEYAGILLSAFSRERDVRVSALTAPARQPASEGYRDPLTERELEVLALLAEGFSNKELASHLVVATSTIKQHLKNIYAKLDVHSRTEALARARELNLII